MFVHHFPYLKFELSANKYCYTLFSTFVFVFVLCYIIFEMNVNANNVGSKQQNHTKKRRRERKLFDFEWNSKG